MDIFNMMFGGGMGGMGGMGGGGGAGMEGLLAAMAGDGAKTFLSSTIIIS